MSVYVTFDNSGGFKTEQIKVFSATSGIDVECHPMLTRLVRRIGIRYDMIYCI
jgi:hypothetical protein